MKETKTDYKHGFITEVESETIRRGLELLATSTAYTELQKLRGKVKFSIKLKDLRNDR